MLTNQHKVHYRNIKFSVFFKYLSTFRTLRDNKFPKASSATRQRSLIGSTATNILESRVYPVYDMIGLDFQK